MANMKYEINREVAKISALSPGKIDKYEILTGEEILPSDQKRIIEQAKITYSLLGKAFEKQTKTIEEQEKKQIDAITNQNKRLEEVSTNKDDDHKDKEIFNELVKERFAKIIELTDEINQNDLVYYFKGSSARKRFDDFNNGVNHFEKIRSGEMKLAEAKKLQNVFKSNLNEISKGRYKSEVQESALKTIKLFYKSREVVIKLVNDYSSIMSEAKCKTKYGEGLKILTPKQMLQRFPIALAQVKAGNTSENLFNDIKQIIYSLY